MAARELRIGVDVQELERRQVHGAGEHRELPAHLLAQFALAACQERQAWRRCRRCHCTVRAQSDPRQSTAGVGAGAPRSWVAKKRTVAAGTSPTAVTLRPSTQVENAQEEPRHEVCDSGPPLALRDSTNTDTEARPS